MKNKIFFFVLVSGLFVFFLQINFINSIRQNNISEKDKLENKIIPLTITIVEKNGLDKVNLPFEDDKDDEDEDESKDKTDTSDDKIEEEKKEEEKVDEKKVEEEKVDEKKVEEEKVDEVKKEEEKKEEEKKEEEKKEEKVDEVKKEEEKKEEEKLPPKEIVEKFKDNEGKEIANKLPLNFIPENGWYEGWNIIPKSFWVKKDFKAGNDFIILENNGSFISCSADGELSVTKTKEESNLFLVELSSEDKIARLRSFFGGYLSINPDGSVDCENRNKDKNNLFYINMTNKLCDKDEVNYIIIETLGNTFLSKDAEKIFSENIVSDNSLFKGILFDIGESKCIEEEINKKEEVEVEVENKEEVDKIALKTVIKKKTKDLRGKKRLKKNINKKDSEKIKAIRRKKNLERKKSILRKKKAFDKENERKRILDELNERNRRRILRKRAAIIKKRALENRKEKAKRDYILSKKKEIEEKRKKINQGRL